MVESSESNAVLMVVFTTTFGAIIADKEAIGKEVGVVGGDIW